MLLFFALSVLVMSGALLNRSCSLGFGVAREAVDCGARLGAAGCSTGAAQSLDVHNTAVVEKNAKAKAFLERSENPRRERVDLAGEQFRNVLRAQDLEDVDILIVGAGLSATVLADMYARKHGKKVAILERRPHIGGNCYDFTEHRTGVLVSLYGPHIFHTSKPDVWKYVHRFSEWTPHELRVIGRVDDKLVPIPVNIDTVNALLDTQLRSETDMQAWLTKERAASGFSAEPQNSRDVGVGRVGQRLYDKLFKEYTKKQWNVYPEELLPVVLSRIPVRADWDDRYFPNDPHQALPLGGYTKWFEEALAHPNIRAYTSVDYFDAIRDPAFRRLSFEKTFFTGQIDQFFRNKGSELKPLQYRSIRFETEVVEEPGVTQPGFLVNHPQFRYGNFTRAAEYKHVFHQKSPKSVVVREYSTDIVDGAEPYYPFPTEENQRHFEQYRALAAAEEKENNVHFVGRLANYKYFNMDDAIENALQLYVRLEGRDKLDAALAEGAARTPDDSAMQVHYVISFPPQGGMEATAAWVQQLCALRQVGPTRVAPKFFVYNMHRGVDDSLARTLFAATRDCADLTADKDLFLRSVPYTQTRELLWLEHMNQHSSRFGDTNVFIDAAAPPGLEALRVGLRAQAATLFAKQRMQASQEAVFRADIRALPKKLPRLPLAVADLEKQLAARPELVNMAHVMALDAEGLRAPHDVSHFGAKPRAALRVMLNKDNGGELPRACPRMGTGLFVASDAAIRRMLSVHRTEIFDTVVPALRRGDKDMATAVALAWYCLFFRPANA